MSKLKSTYEAAIAKLGKDLTLAVTRGFGGIDSYEEVPAARHDGLIAALNKIMHGEGRISMAQARMLAHGDSKAPPKSRAATEQDRVFRTIRADAYGDDDDDGGDTVKPAAAQLDSVAIFQRWNASRRKTDADD
jgi:hypothetical protein